MSIRPTAARNDQRGGNPHVSSASRFRDDVWDFWQE